MSKKPHIVCIGGGNAMPKAVLAGLKKKPVQISAICAMLDSGGSAGRLRKDYNIVSPGDIRRAFIALANTSPAVENLFNYRFQAGELKGHNFANLFITALELSNNSYEKTMKEMKRFLNVEHQVLPATLDKAQLCAVLENGKVVVGETNIDVPKHNGNLRIKKLFLKPEAKAYPKSIKAIREADLIVIGPGDLYSSLAQVLLTRGIPEAIKRSKAKKVLVCNIMTKLGETNGFTVSDFVSEAEKLLGSRVDYAIFNATKPSKARLEASKRENPELLDILGFNEALLKDKKFVGRDILTFSGPLAHDTNKLTDILLKLCHKPRTTTL